MTHSWPILYRSINLRINNIALSRTFIIIADEIVYVGYYLGLVKD
jgi:hypothetical protein